MLRNRSVGIGIGIGIGLVNDLGLGVGADVNSDGLRLGVRTLSLEIRLHLCNYGSGLRNYKIYIFQKCTHVVC